MKKAFLFFGLLIFVLTACKQDNSVSQIVGFENHSWGRYDYLNFEFPIQDVEQQYNIMVILRYNEDFPSQALAINFVMTMPSGEERIKEYLLQLRDKNEEMLGEKKTGYYEQLFPIRNEMRLNEPGLLKIEIENLMTKYFTPGLVEFGVLIEPKD
jgi:gliding motility-associated lipoprotein GldH